MLNPGTFFSFYIHPLIILHSGRHYIIKTQVFVGLITYKIKIKLFYQLMIN